MTHPLDHIVVAVQALETAIRDYRALGFTVVAGGVHANGATHNALVSFEDGTYIELLALTGEPPKPNMLDFSALLANGEGLVGYALRSNDLEADKGDLHTNGIHVGEIVDGQRLRGDGVRLQWKLALRENGFAPFYIQDVTPREWRVSTASEVVTHANQAVGLRIVASAPLASVELLFKDHPPSTLDTTKTHGVRFDCVQQ